MTSKQQHSSGKRRPLPLLLVLVLVAGAVGVLLSNTLGQSPGRAKTSQVESSRGPASADPGPSLPSGPALSPESFGAVGDGVTDDSAALQRAIDAATHQGGSLRLHTDRIYLCSRSIRLPSRAALVGGGSSSVLHFDWTENRAGTDGFYVGNADQVAGNADIVVKNLTIRGAGSGLPSGPNNRLPHPVVPGIRLREVAHFRISGVQVSHVPGISILYQGSSDGAILRNHVHDSGRDGITGTSLRPDRANIVVAHNLIERVGDDGLAIIGSADQESSDAPAEWIVVRSNRVRGWSRNPNGRLLGRGVAVLNFHRALIADNIIDRTKSDGILVTDRWNGAAGGNARGGRPDDVVRVVRNTVVRAGVNTAGSMFPLPGSALSAIDVVDSHRVELISNRVSRSAGLGIRVRRCFHCSVRN